MIEREALARHASERPPLTGEQVALREELHRDLVVLASDIGPRHAWRPTALDRASRYLEGELRAGGHQVVPQNYTTREGFFRNLVAEVPGGSRADEVVVIGAHYDSIFQDDCPGANDNGSGVVAVLALARRFARAKLARTLRFALFVNEEPPFFWTNKMGSRVYAHQCRQRGDKIVGMLSLETIGYYTDAPDSQRYPPLVGWVRPKVGDFVAFVGNVSSHRLLHHAVDSFREHATIPAESAALPGWLPGVFWSDHWSFWKEGYPALMVTDTAPFRYPHYHARTDTVDQVNFEGLTRVVDGLTAVVADLCGTD